MSKEYAYKVTIIEKVGKVERTTIIETSDLDFVFKLTGFNSQKPTDVSTEVEIDSDLPNRNISKEWEDLVERYKKIQEGIQNNPVPPYVTPFSPIKTYPYYPEERYPFGTDNKNPPFNLKVTC